MCVMVSPPLKALPYCAFGYWFSGLPFESGLQEPHCLEQRQQLCFVYLASVETYAAGGEGRGLSEDDTPLCGPIHERSRRI